MSSFSFRPSFSHELDMPVERAVETIVGRVSQEPASFEVRSFPGFICLRIPVSDRHFWTPRLMLGMESSSGEKTSVHGTYGPNANVWSLYVYGFLIIGTGGLFSGILGLCQWQLGMTAWGLWVFWALLALAAGLYLMAQFGQKLAAQQTFTLHQAYERAAGQSIPIH